MPATGNSSALPGRMTPKWVSGQTYPEGFVVWSPTDFQDYRRKSAGSSATDPASDLTNWQPTGDRAVKSIQRGVFSSTTLSASGATITIAAVNTGKAELSIQSAGAAKDATNSTTFPYQVDVILTNSTTITVTHRNSGTAAVSFGWQVIERY